MGKEPPRHRRFDEVARETIGAVWRATLRAVAVSAFLLSAPYPYQQARAEDQDSREKKEQTQTQQSDLKTLLQSVESLTQNESVATEEGERTQEDLYEAVAALRAQVETLVEEVRQLSEDFQLLAALGRKETQRQATLAFAASTRERLRVLERTLTDLTARTEYLEHEKSPSAAPPGLSQTLAGEDLFLHAQSLIRARQIEQAIPVLESFVRNNPKHARLSEAFFLLGESYALLEDDTASAEAFLRGYKIDKKTAFAPRHLVRLGQSLLRLNKRVQACRAFRKFQQDFAETQRELNGIVEVEIAANACAAS